MACRFESGHSHQFNNMKKSNHIKLTKVHTIIDHNTVIKDSYWAKGELIADIEVGSPIRMWRTSRARQNPEESPTVNGLGLFTSSPVQKIEGNLIYTKNSIWELSDI